MNLRIFRVFRAPLSSLSDHQCTLSRIKMVWQSKKVSKSVGRIFNKFNAFWVLLCILFNILAHFIFITTKIDFRGGFILNFLANKRHVYFYSHFSVNCQWASWGSWQSCSRSCGGGTKKRYRSKSVVAQNGGYECSGSPSMTRLCNTNKCIGTNINHTHTIPHKIS